MLVDLLPDNFIEGLSGEPIDRWLDLTKAIISIAERARDGVDDPYYSRDLKREAVYTSNEAAVRCKLELSDLDHVCSRLRKSLINTDDAFHALRECYHLERRARFGQRFAASTESTPSKSKQEPVLLLSNRSVVEIHNHLGALRRSVSESDLASEKKQGLESLMNEFELLLNSKKTNKSSILRALALVAASITGATAFMAEAPDALETIGKIASVLGQEIESSDAIKRLEEQRREQKALPKPPMNGTEV